MYQLIQQLVRRWHSSLVPTPERDGGSELAKVLHTHQISRVFTLCGGHISPILVACTKLGIDVVDVRHESTAVFAADATARLTGVPGVALVTAGPGVTNTITALKNAQLAQSPVIVVGGAAPSMLTGRGALQDIEQIPLVRSVVKEAWSVSSVKDIPSTMTLAFQKALTGVPGPVFVEVAIDLLYPEQIVREQYALRKKSKQSLGTKLVQWYINRKLNGMFRWEEDEKAYQPRPLPKTAVKEGEIVKVVQLLQKAQKPLLIIGSQALVNAQLAPEVAKALEQLGIPVYLSGMARGLMGRKNILQFRHNRRQALQEADVVLLAGVPLDFRMGYGRGFRRHTKIISLNLSKKDLTMNKKPNIGLVVNPGEFLIRLGGQYSSSRDERMDWFALLEEREQKRNTQIYEQSKESVGKINPIHLLTELETHLPDDSILIADGGDFVGTAAYVLNPRQPLGWLDPGLFGTLGSGAGFALGVKLCRPESQVWLLYGDGSVGYTLAEWDSFVRHKIAVAGLVGNDSSWAQVAREQVNIYASPVATELGDRRYDKVVEGFGAKGLFVTEEANIRSVFEDAQQTLSRGTPVLVNVMIDRTDFRKGSVSV